MLTQLFQPEPAHLKGLAFAKELQRQGHEVEVLTGFPNYPQGKLYDGYQMQLSMREVLDGVPVTRLALYIDHSASGLKRFFSYTSFASLAAILGPFQVQRPDVVHVYQGPATLCLPAWLFTALWGTPYVLDVQDIWPESVTASGMLRFPGSSALLNFWSNLTYRLARKIVVLSEGYKTTLIQRGVPAEKIAVVYNWCNEHEMLLADNEKQGAYTAGMSGKFNIVFAGNIGKLQALETVLLAAGKLQEEFPQVQILLVGDGVELDHLKQYAARLTVENVIFIPRQPIDKIGAILSAADALLIHLKDEPLCRIGIPQKTQAYMAMGKPIVIAARGDSADLVRRAGAGIVCEPENPAAMADAIQALVKKSPKEREALGYNGRSFYNQKLSFGVGVKRMISIFEEVIRH